MNDLEQFRADITQNFKDFVGEAWEKMTEIDKRLLADLAKDAAQLHLKNLTSGTDELKHEIIIVNASLLNLTIATYMPVKKVFWQAVERAATLAASVLTKVAIGAIVAI